MVVVAVGICSRQAILFTCSIAAWSFALHLSSLFQVFYVHLLCFGSVRSGRVQNLRQKVRFQLFNTQNELFLRQTVAFLRQMLNNFYARTVQPSLKSPFTNFRLTCPKFCPLNVLSGRPSRDLCGTTDLLPMQRWTGTYLPISKIILVIVVTFDVLLK